MLWMELIDTFVEASSVLSRELLQCNSNSERMVQKRNGIHSLIGALVLLACRGSSAFAPSLASCPSLETTTRGDSVTVCEMAETSYPFREDRTTSFLSPLFPDYTYQSPATRSSPSRNTRGLLSSTSSLIFSSRGSFSFLETSNLDDDDDNDDEILAYLPGKGADLSPKTRDLLKQVTLQYVNGGGPNAVTVDNVLDVIDEEYKSRDVAVIVGDTTFDLAASAQVDDADLARILSFAALHRLPKDVAILLFGPSDTNDENNLNNKNGAFQKCRIKFARNGWKQVSFPRGLAIRPRRKFVKSKSKRYMPMPRTWMKSRKEAIRNAQQAVDEATYTQAPPRRLLSREEFLRSMDKELAATEPTELLPTLFRDARLFFPRQNLKLKRLRKVFKKQFVLVKAAGLAGVMSYLALSFAWYTIAILAQWRHSTSTVEMSSRALGTALRRFGKVLVGAYIGSQLTRSLRLKIALVLAPFGNRVLRLTQKKLRISETKAFALLSGAVLGTCLALWSIIVLGDAVVLRTAGALNRFEHVPSPLGIESSI